jgi:hypothetical protein
MLINYNGKTSQEQTPLLDKFSGRICPFFMARCVSTNKVGNRLVNTRRKPGTSERLRVREKPKLS